MKHFSLISKKDIFRARQKGAAAVEFAIVISLLVLITGGIIEFGRVLWYYDALTKATRDGARFMSAVPNDTISTNITAAQNLVVNAASAANVSPVLTSGPSGNVDVTCEPAPCQNGVAPEYVKVAITRYSVTFGSWFAIPLPSGPLTLAPYTTMRYMCDAGATTSC